MRRVPVARWLVGRGQREPAALHRWRCRRRRRETGTGDKTLAGEHVDNTPEPVSRFKKHPAVLRLIDDLVARQLAAARGMDARLCDLSAAWDRDAVHAAVMLNHGIRRLASFDRGFDAVPGVERLDL